MNAEPRFATPRNYDRRTLGPEVREIMAGLGEPAMPWQGQSLDVFYELDEEATEEASSKAGLFQPRLWYREGRLTVPRQSGKTTKAKARHIHRMRLSRPYGWGPRPLSFYMAQTASDARDKMVEEWFPAIEESPFDEYVKQYIRSNGRECIKWDGGGRITVKPPSRTGGHGGSPDLIDLDEAFAHRDGTAEQGVRPGMITKVSPQIYVVSTAGTAESEYLWGKVDDGRQRCQLYEGGQLDAFGRVAYFEWSAPESETDYGNPEVWARCMPALGITQPLEAVHAEWDAMDVDEFRRAYLNQWTAAVERIIPGSAWAGCLDPVSQLVGPEYLAVDASPGVGSGRTVSIAVAGRNAAGKIHGEIIDSAPGLSWAADRIGHLTMKHRKIERLFVDPTGPIGAILPDIREASVAPIETIDAKTMAAACGRFHEAVIGRPSSFVHIGQDILDRAVEGAAKRQLLDSWAWARRTSASDISPLVAVTLAHWAAATAPQDSRML